VTQSGFFRQKLIASFNLDKMAASTEGQSETGGRSSAEFMGLILLEIR
jgi:hypothetical protein